MIAPSLHENLTSKDLPLNTKSLSWYVVPESIKHWLLLASQHWNEPTRADGYMQQALALVDDQVDVWVSAYRYFFYTQNYPMALQMAINLMEQIRDSESLPDEWEQLKAILSDRHDDPKIRLYINAYAASGLINARLGEIEAAKKIALNVSEVERCNEFGGHGVRQILDPPVEDEDEDEP